MYVPYVAGAGAWDKKNDSAVPKIKRRHEIAIDDLTQRILKALARAPAFDKNLRVKKYG